MAWLARNHRKTWHICTLQISAAGPGALKSTGPSYSRFLGDLWATLLFFRKLMGPCGEILYFSSQSSLPCSFRSLTTPSLNQKIRSSAAWIYGQLEGAYRNPVPEIYPFLSNFPVSFRFFCLAIFFIDVRSNSSWNMEVAAVHAFGIATLHFDL